MKVLHVISRLDEDSGGHSRSVPQQIIFSNRMGVQTDILAERKSVSLIDEVGMVRRAGGKVILLPKIGYREMCWAGGTVGRRIASLMAGYDIVHINGIWVPICHLGSMLARRMAKPVMMTPHGMLQPWPLRNKWIKKKVARWLYQDSDLASAAVVRATSCAEAEELRQINVKGPIAIIPNGIGRPPRIRRLRRSGFRRAVFLSRIDPKKGLPDLVKAVAVLAVKLRMKRWRIVIAGYGDANHLAEIKSLISRLAVVDLFSFVGRVEGTAKWRLLRSADIFILPSRAENFGLVIAEALASGLPTITTMATPWAELESFRCGWWIPVGVASLSRTLARATSLPRSDLRRMGKRGEALVKERYTWERVTCQLLDVYRWMLGEGSRPATVKMLSSANERDFL